MDEIEDYNNARHSLFIYPIKGGDESEIKENLRGFISEILGLHRLASDEDGIDFVRRSITNRNAPSEVLVRFRDSAARDTVIGSSGMLSEMVDKKNNNRPTAGIRIVVPQHLKNLSKLFEEYGRRLRQRHRGAKHHIKFDDVEGSLFLNIRLREDPNWTRVYRDSADTWVRQQRKEEAARLDKRLNSIVSEDLLDSAAGPFQALATTTTAARKTKRAEWTGEASGKDMDTE